MSIINVNALVHLIGESSHTNHYSYVRVKNMLHGLKGKSSKKEIQTVRRTVEKEMTRVVTTLKELEDKL